MTALLFFHAATLAAVAYLLFATSVTERHLMSTQDSIDAVVAELTKVRDEVAQAKADLTDQIAALTTQLEDAEAADAVDLSGLEAIAQSLDDLNPDAGGEIPTEVEEADLFEVDAAPVKGDGDR